MLLFMIIPKSPFISPWSELKATTVRSNSPLHNL
jgi:hypothetical protein